MARDFSQPAGGRRLRIPLSVYNPETKQFIPQREAAFLVTVEDEAEQKRLWKTIEDAIESGDWKNDRAAGGRRRAGRAEARI